MKKFFNFLLKIFILKIKLSRFNLILGGGIGILRGLFLSYLFLIIFSYFNYKKYTFYIKNSIFFSTFLHLINYWIDCS
ncbi:hypothetical protein D9V75_00805 [Buchnera aphidicola (Muscaphis stroyani)]|uniref:Uncharacterized protein n=1 Tax=Buchnera aphidicola (Muscaphis stroyani) TaxID=1241869 RepID=A0A4D6YFW5_9GAMM|nr:hypothetical protein D9V75_00805 [Buchnera aphidicola (Muscaphis stroyani)]